MNVFDRYLKASRIYKSEYIVRITSDCPLIDPEMVDKMTKIVKKKDYDYFSNINPPTFPDGFDIEIFKSNLLNVQLKLGLNHLDKEHVTYNIKKLNFISKGNFCTLEDKSHYRITVDYKDDLNILKKISSKKDLNLIDTHEVLKILRNEKLTKRIRNVKLNMNQTKNMWYKANKYIPNGNSLLSKNPRIYEEDNWPSHYESAYGIQIKDLDGKKYLDFSNMGVGTNILGYNNKKVNKFVISKINNSNMSSLNCPEEVLLAEKLVQIHPWSQKALFARTGAEANSIAVRLARAYTKKNIVLICGYHGWNDWYLSANYSNKKFK